MKHSIIASALLVTAGACSGGSLVIEKPKSADLNAAITQMWSDEVKRNAQTGDWILTRSYSLTGDVIVGATRGESVSHSSIYDARTGTIIEALTPEVREVPLESLLERNQLVIVVRPSNLTAEQRIDSVDRARTMVGSRFDYGGLLGFDSGTKFYCSELLYWASGLDADERPLVVTPASLMNYGEVIYYSGKREDPRVQNAALGRRSLAKRRAAMVAH